MTDDAMRKAFMEWFDNSGAKPIAAPPIPEATWIGWQAATTALLEKLTNEGMREKISDVVKPWVLHINGVSVSNELINAVIEALEKELVG